MKQRSIRAALAAVLALALLLSLAACAAKPADVSPEAPESTPTPAEPTPTPSAPETPEDPPVDETPETPPVEEPTEEPETHPVTDEMLLALIEQQDAEYPGHTPFLAGRKNEENGDVHFQVAFRSASGWLVYAAKEYTASFNDDGGHIIATETVYQSEDGTPRLSAQAADPEALLPLIEKMEIGMLGEHAFNFAGPADLTSDELYTAYLLLAGEEELQKRYNEAEGLYFITWFNIKQVLDRYFVAHGFDVTECSLYDESFDGIVTNLVSGFGGERFIQLSDITLDDADHTVTFTGNFYSDDTYQTLTKQKTYRLEFYDGEDGDGYHYLSAMEFVAD